MLIKRKENQTDKTIIIDPKTREVLFQFNGGVFETDDDYIISVWAKYYNNSVSIDDEINGEEELKPKRRGRPKKAE